METENSLVLRKAAKDAQMAYFNHLSADGKRDPERERWIEAMAAGADAITRASVLASRLAQVERERDAAVKAVEWYPCFTCKNISSAHCEDCLRNRNLALDRAGKYLPDNYEWRGVCAENTKEKETLQEEETR
ncbi:MAG: hypothetical protein PUD63_12095 [Clostridia bacterium]|nr:hypothetical protein [Clostridia bacterium]